MSALRLLSSVRTSTCLRWPFLSVPLPLLSQGAYGSFPWVCDSFGSKVSLSDRVARWAESLLFLLAPSPSPPGVSSVFPGCPLGFLLFRFCNYFSSFVFCLGWFSFLSLGEFSFRSLFLGSLLLFSSLSFTFLPSSIDGCGYHAAVLVREAGLCLPSLRSAALCPGAVPACMGVGVQPSGSLLAATPWFPGLLELLVAVPVFLPQRRDLLRRPLFFPLLQSLPVLYFIAFISLALRSQIRLHFAGSRLLAFCRCSSSRLPY